MKKNYLLITFFVLAGLCFSATAQNYPESSYDISGDGKTLVKWKGDETDIDFTKDDKLKELTKIGASAFSGKTKIKNIVIGDKVEIIGRSAFWACTKIENMVLGKGLRILEQESLCSLESLTEISLPPLLEKIGVAAFQSCSKLAKVSFEGNKLVEIEENAFSSCVLEECILPESVKIIGTTAFFHNETLKKISLPKALETLGANPFSRCYLLEAYEISEDNEHFITIDGVLYSKDKTKLLMYPCGKPDPTFTIPGDVVSIEENAFFGNKDHIKNIIIPETVKEIGIKAFFDTYVLENITLPNSITILSESLFENSGIQTLEIGSEVTKIDHRAIYACERLTKLISKTPTPPKFDSDWVFYNTEFLNELIVPTGSKSAYEADKLWKKFLEQKELTAIKYKRDDKTPTVVKEQNFGDEAPISPYKGSYELSADGSTLVKWTGKETEIDFNLDSKLKEINKIGSDAFNPGLEDFSELEKIVISDNVKIIGSSAFEMCTELNSVKIGEGVEEIGAHAFNQCISISGELIIPASVVKIGDKAFDECSSIETISFEGNNLKEIGKYAFSGVNEPTHYNLPESLETIGDFAFNNNAALKSIKLPKKLKSIGISAFDMCDALAAFEIDADAENYMEKEGVLYTKDEKTLHTYPKGKEGSSFEIPKEVESIGAYAFRFNEILTELKIPETVTEIGEYALSYLKKMETLVLPNSLKSIPTYAFTECSKLESVELGNKVDFIGTQAFTSCRNLRKLISKNPNPPVLEDQYVFNNVENLELVIPKGSTEKYKAAPLWKKFIEENPNITLVEDENLPSSVINAKAQKKFRLFVNASVLSIDNVEPGVNITIYSISGQQIFNKKAGSTREEIVLNQGMYIVKVGDVAEKIIVR